MLKEKNIHTHTHTSIADGNSRNATWQLNRGGLASFWRNSAGSNASWSGLRRWWPYTVSCLYNQDAFQCTPPNRRPVAERPHCSFSFSLSSLEEFVCPEHISHNDGKRALMTPELRYLTRRFLDKRAKSGERKPLGSMAKVEGGLLLDCCWTQQETGSARLMRPSFLKQPIKAWKHRGAWPTEEPALQRPETRDRIITVKDAEMRWPDMNVGTKPKGGAPETSAFALINKSISASSELEHLTNLDRPCFHSLLLQRKELFVIWEAPCALSGSVFVYWERVQGPVTFWEPEWLWSGSPHPSMGCLVCRQELRWMRLVTVMDAQPDRWMNGVTWWLDNRNCPQDWRSKW